SAIDADQYMLASPISVKSVSTPSAAKAWARTSETWLFAHCVSHFPEKTCRSHEARMRQRIFPPLSSAAAGREAIAAGSAAPRSVCAARDSGGGALSAAAAEG